MRIIAPLLIYLMILIGCSNDSKSDSITNCDFRSICGIVPGKNFNSETETSQFCQFSFISNHSDVISWVYNWAAVSSNFKHLHKKEFLDLTIRHLEDSGQVLFTGENLEYWFNGKGKLYDARCRVIKITDLDSKCIIEILHLKDLN